MVRLHTAGQSIVDALDCVGGRGNFMPRVLVDQLHQAAALVVQAMPAQLILVEVHAALEALAALIPQVVALTSTREPRITSQHLVANVARSNPLLLLAPALRR